MIRFSLISIIIIALVGTISAQDFKNYMDQGDSCLEKRELSQSISFYKKAIDLNHERLITKEDEIIIFSKLGDVYFELAEYQVALEYYFKYLEKDMIKNNDSILSNTYNKIGRCYGNLKQLDQALKFFKKTMETAGTNPGFIGRAYNNIADVYLSRKQYVEAKDYFVEANQYFNEANDYIGLIVSNINLGTIELETNRIEMAQAYFQKADLIATENRDTSFLIITHVYLANYFIKITDFDNAQKNLEWALANAIKKKSPQYVTESYQGLVKLYEAKKSYKKAFEYLKLFKTSSDSIFNQNSSRDYAELEAKFSIREKEKENELLKKEQYFSELRVESQKKYIWMLGGLVIVSVLFIGLFYIQRKKVGRSKRELEAQNKEIKKSQKQMKDLNRQYEKLIEKYEGKSDNS